MLEDPASAWTSVYCLRPYNPWKINGAPNPDFHPPTDGRLLDLKDGKEHGIARAIEDFLAGLQVLRMPQDTILAIVPGHDASPTNEHRPLASVAHGLAAAAGRYVVRVDSLIRTSSVPRQAASGERTVRRHLKSMKANGAAELRGATVLLLDDAVTTGCSMRAARILLTEAGACVAAVALGRTSKYF
jgi:predicted amidophosphoribosyltransferase